MYKSPIEIKLNDIVSDTVEKADEYIVRFVQQVGVNVDKDELIKALKFDREQYEKGWNDRDNEIVRCKDCKYNYNNLIPSGEAEHECTKCIELPITADFHCAWGERREDDKG